MTGDVKDKAADEAKDNATDEAPRNQEWLALAAVALGAPLIVGLFTCSLSKAAEAGDALGPLASLASVYAVLVALTSVKLQRDGLKQLRVETEEQGRATSLREKELATHQAAQTEVLRGLTTLLTQQQEGMRLQGIARANQEARTAYSTVFARWESYGRHVTAYARWHEENRSGSGGAEHFAEIETAHEMLVAAVEVADFIDGECPERSVRLSLLSTPIPLTISIMADKGERAELAAGIMSKLTYQLLVKKDLRVLVRQAFQQAAPPHVPQASAVVADSASISAVSRFAAPSESPA